MPPTSFRHRRADAAVGLGWSLSAERRLWLSSRLFRFKEFVVLGCLWFF